MNIYFPSAIRKECELTITQAPERITQIRVKRNRPCHGWPLLMPDCTEIPVTTARRILSTNRVMPRSER